MSTSASVFPPPSARPPSARAVHILVVDDFEPMRKVTVTQLRQFGLGENVMQAFGDSVGAFIWHPTFGSFSCFRRGMCGHDCAE